MLKLMQCVSVGGPVCHCIEGMKSRFCQTSILKLLIMSRLDIFSLMFIDDDDETFFLTADLKPAVGAVSPEFSQDGRFLMGLRQMSRFKSRRAWAGFGF